MFCGMLVHRNVRRVTLPEGPLRLPSAAGVGSGDAHGPARAGQSLG